MIHRNLVVISKIIFFYSLFYIFLKLVVLFKASWLVIPNLLLVCPFLLLAGILGWQIKTRNYSWFWVVIGTALIILTRVFETRLVFWIQHQLPA